MIGGKIVNSYRETVGGGHSSAEFANSPSVSKFLEICQRHAIIALNESKIGHQAIPAVTLLFTVANPLVASLVANPHTIELGLGIAKTPVLAAAWGGEAEGNNIGLSPIEGIKEDMAQISQAIRDGVSLENIENLFKK